MKLYDKEKKHLYNKSYVKKSSLSISLEMSSYFTNKASSNFLNFYWNGTYTLSNKLCKDHFLVLNIKVQCLFKNMLKINFLAFRSFFLETEKNYNIKTNSYC